MKKNRPDRLTPKQILAHLNAQRPLDAPEITIARKKRRKWQDDTTDGIGGTDTTEKPE